MRKLPEWKNTCLPRLSTFRWSTDAVADLHAAIREGGFEGQPLVQKHVKIVTTILLKSTSGKGVTQKGGAGVPCLPSF